MKCSYSYFVVQWKRIWRTLPPLLFVNLSVCVCVGVLAFFFVRDGMLASGKLKFKIGVVGDMTNSYLGFGMDTLQALDDTRFMAQLIGMSEQEARQALQKGELDAFVIIPDGMMEAIESGANDRRITYVTPVGQMGLSTIVAHEIMDMISEMVTRAQSGIYGMQEMLARHGKEEALWEAVLLLNFRYLDLTLGRADLCQLELLGMADGLSTEGYYFCSLLLFCLILIGINGSILLAGKNEEIPRLLSARGVGAAWQVMGEYMAYVGLMFICMGAIFLAVAAVFGSGMFQIAEWKGMGAEPLVRFGFWLIVPALMIAAMQFLLCELASGVVSGILLQFLCGIGMGYLSGFFYPADFFPKALQTIGGCLPTGVALRCAESSITGDFALWAWLGALVYLGGFLGWSVYARKIRILRG